MRAVAMRKFDWGIANDVDELSKYAYNANLRIQAGVYFNDPLKNTPVGQWLRENISGRYAIRENHIYFEDCDDALLCYLRYKG